MGLMGTGRSQRLLQSVGSVQTPVLSSWGLQEVAAGRTPCLLGTLSSAGSLKRGWAEPAHHPTSLSSWAGPDYIKRMRYCEYLGKYFCQCCHENAQTVIPSRILRKWDFSKYYVSNFSKDLLSKIWSDPLFNVQDINPALYRKVKSLNQVWVSPFPCLSAWGLGGMGGCQLQKRAGAAGEKRIRQVLKLKTSALRVSVHISFPVQ